MSRPFAYLSLVPSWVRPGRTQTHLEPNLMMGPTPVPLDLGGLERSTSPFLRYRFIGFRGYAPSFLKLNLARCAESS